MFDLFRYQTEDGRRHSRGRTVVILLTGGTRKDPDQHDIELAKRYWADWKRRKP